MPQEGSERAIQRLVEVFGDSSSNTLGSAVFKSELKIVADELDGFAQASYKRFVGDAWETIGQANWTKVWIRLYRRLPSVKPGILAELNGLTDSATSLAASQVTENHDDPSAAEQALQLVFDSDAIQDVSIYRIGDSDAITGVLIAGITGSGIAVALVFLMD